ncbi:tRNA (adenosine(37)-N6)-dimethylallyltransferase MiaA [Neolewinella agarilytica]|uniref:tRNA dimethylallyltransferase n=1 Tax=Neolewinella agarilytica TaxID=478744 RepID=A0A1H9CXM0_9BACT|nr:tRNA (adenosine(37)-N6)-dimethylallyltransferase MiaA [Neolewinella agarilytica]SEQ05343.1 tRNA dimethylallyltransferase [Neolewinella agarilytica]
MKPRLIVIGGPTASGKTSLAIEVAKHYRTEIISADSRQFYTEMKIGNARPTEEELAQVPHHFVADRSLMDPLTAGRLAEAALDLLTELFQRHQVVVLTGGSGLYLRALCEGLDEFPEVTGEAQTQVQGLLEEQGITGLQALLQELDPAYFAVVDHQNARRLERALKVCLSSGKPYSSFLGNRPERPFDCRYFTTNLPRPLLYDRINRRVDLMLEAGLEAEARSLSSFRHLPVLQTVGYQEWWPYFEEEYSRDRAIELIKQNSRRYAKRQVTWFKKGGLYQPVNDLADIVEKMTDAN